MMYMHVAETTCPFIIFVRMYGIHAYLVRQLAVLAQSSSHSSIAQFNSHLVLYVSACRLFIPHTENNYLYMQLVVICLVQKDSFM